MLAAGAAGAQTPPPTVELLCDPGSYPYDAVAAAPLQHKVMFEDEHVRVLQINLPPYQAEPIHIHALPSVIEGDRDPAARFAYVTYRFQNGRFVEAERQEIAPSGGYAATWTAPEGPHSIVNLSAVWVRFTRIEIKPEGCAGR
jgi:hypothetical protein